jgi:Glutathione-dependent formaldehyde-activating enzyme
MGWTGRAPAPNHSHSRFGASNQHRSGHFRSAGVIRYHVCVEPKVNRMRRRFRGGKPTTTRAGKIATAKRRTGPKAVRPRSFARAGKETEVARVTRELSEALERQAATAARRASGSRGRQGNEQDQGTTGERRRGMIELGRVLINRIDRRGLLKSGNVRLQAFCPRCGTAIYASSTGDEPKAYNVRLGAVRQRNGLLPRRQIFVRSQQAWVNDLNSIPKFDVMPPH